ncbi:MAG TPA: TPM domain-containing protein [Tepidisphaeraceae bacterium]|nr:TPM domain-containing protein [Tepidisphaeraceae bacterium]
MKFRLVLAFLLLTCVARGAEVIPPAPAQYFNDYANVTSPATAEQLNGKLKDFEAQTSNQIVAVIYPKMQSDSSVDDYCIRVFNKWKVGQKGKNNGAALFVFVNDRKMFIVTGYGLEGALPDATCKLIIENEIKPRFKAGDYSGGMKAGVEAMMAATKGEYKGTGRTVGGGQDVNGVPYWLPPVSFFVLILVIQMFLRRHTSYGRSGRMGGWYIGGGGWGGGGGGWGGGGGGGGFSGGGGSSGGGGAGGSW